MKIGNLEFQNNVFLAPMAGVTDIAFRGLCKEMGCSLVYTEMVSAKALYYENDNTKNLLRISEEEMPVAAQIFGNNPKIMAEVVDKYFNDREDICIIDINMGCPVNKITKNGEGSALLKHPELAANIVREIKKVSLKPVTVKIRKGFDEGNVNAVEVAKRLEEAGADAIAIHGRTREQMYEGKADWNIIKDVKDAVSIPVIGNGDVFEVQDAVNLLEKTKCDAIMIGRGAQGNPWIFNRINHYMKTGEILPEPTLEEKITTAIKHMNLAVAEHGDYVAVREMRKHIGWYLKGLKNSAKYRDQINKITDYKEVIAMLEEYMQHSLTQIG